MTEYTTIRVRRDAKEQAEKRKPEEMTWSEYLASEEYEPTLSVTADIDATERNELARAVANQLRES